MKKLIAILMLIALIGVSGCGNKTSTPEPESETEIVSDVSESKSTERSSVGDKLAEINGTPINGEWTDDEYGHLTVSMTFDDSGNPGPNYLEYTAATDDPENLIRVCTAMNAFIALNEKDGKAKKDDMYRSALPGENAASVFCMMSIISGTELDGTEVDGIPSWYDEYDGTDEDFLNWLLECYGECIDEIKARTEQINQLIEEYQ